MSELHRVLVSIVSEQQAFPGGTVGGNWAVSITQGETLISEGQGAGKEYEFTLPAGNYTAEAVRLSSTGEQLGVVTSTVFEVIDVPVDVLIDVAQSVSATVMS